MQVGAKQLRNETAKIIKKVKRGEEITVTYRGKPVAVIKPIVKKEESLSEAAFGIWADREDMKDPGRWLEEKRRLRYKE